MRLLFVAHCFPPANRPLAKVGGMQRVGMDLLAALQSRGDCQIEPVTLRAAGMGMALKAVPFYFYALWRIWRRCRSGQIDAVLFSAMPTAWLALLIKPALKRDVPMATIAHGQDVILPFAPYQMLVRKIFRRIDAVMPVSRATGQEVLRRGLPPGRLHVIHNGIDLTRFPAPPLSGRRRAILMAVFPQEAQTLPSGALLLLATGRQVRRKGHAWFVGNVMPLLPPHIHLWLGGEGPEAAIIDAQATRHGVATRVRRLGLLTDAQMEALYRGADLFVMPNIREPGDIEGFGVVMLEAGLNGLTTLAARLEGIEDAVADGVSGVLVESGNARSFEQAILAFDADRARLERFGAQAARYTRETFDWSRIAERYLTVLRGLAARVK